jgi:C4-dicarboxylate-specific signal transduction histidine kinase
MLATRLRNMAGYTQEREKLIQLGSMAAGLAHELNNPATAAHEAARAGGRECLQRSCEPRHNLC